jgi:pyruvate/2-oxoglutarate dehydrogenase complex dihydrolipoamide acyltransferase (E2) component
MKAAISVDHRVRDGAEAAQPKVQALAGFLQNPVRV